MAPPVKSKVKVGVVGCGVVATAYYLPYLCHMPEVKLVAVCDLSPERTAACLRLFGAKEAYHDYDEMLAQADIDAVFILTAPGTHVDFTLKAAAHKKHILIQKPMALTLEDAHAIVNAVRDAGVKALVEPSQNSPLDPLYPTLRALIQQGVLGRPYWFSYLASLPDREHPSLGGNPYGMGAFYARDSGGLLFDFPYAPNQIVSLLGSCKSVTGLAKISVPQRAIVPETQYNEFLVQATDPDQANYWDVVVQLPRTQQISMQAEDNIFSLYEMANGAIGEFHAAHPMHPVLPGTGAGGFRVFGTDGNLILGYGYAASIFSQRKDLLPHIADDGWYHIPITGDVSKAAWPKPLPGGFNYYHASTQHLIDCIREDRDPLLTVEWGRHVTEMMYGAIVSSRTGQRYTMTTTLEGVLT